MKALNKNVPPLAKCLLGNNDNKIMLVNYAIEHLDQLLGVKPGGQFEPLDIVQFIRWCEV